LGKKVDVLIEERTMEKGYQILLKRLKEVEDERTVCWMDE
jgi:hypothetical protein